MKIVQYPHPALRHPARPLTAIDKNVRLQVGRMLELMYAARGLGLAAPQVALPFQFFVMNRTADPAQQEHELVFINPVILERKGGLVEGEEGCLSFPDLFQKVRRFRTIRVHAYNLNGEAVEYECSDMDARIILHETDHLHGVLFIDKMGPIGKLASRSALKELERQFRKAQERGEYPPDEEIKRQLKALEQEAEPPPPSPPEPPPQPTQEPGPAM